MLNVFVDRELYVFAIDGQLCMAHAARNRSTRGVSLGDDPTRSACQHIVVLFFDAGKTYVVDAYDTDRRKDDR